MPPDPGPGSAAAATKGCHFNALYKRCVPVDGEKKGDSWGGGAARCISFP